MTSLRLLYAFKLIKTPVNMLLCANVKVARADVV